MLRLVHVSADDLAACFPGTLMSAQAVIDMVWGEITVHWFRRYGQLTLHVTVPFATRTRIVFSEKACEVGSGFHVFSIDESADT